MVVVVDVRERDEVEKRLKRFCLLVALTVEWKGKVRDCLLFCGSDAYKQQ